MTFSKMGDCRPHPEAASSHARASAEYSHTMTQEGFDTVLHSATLTIVQSSGVDSPQYLGKRVGFAEMAKRVSQKWKALDQPTLEKYFLLASQDNSDIWLKKRITFSERISAAER